MKYIIKVPEDRVQNGRLLIMAATEDGCDHWINTGIKAIKYDGDEAKRAKQAGQNEAWELITAIGKMTDMDLRECFGENIILELPYDEAREMYETWKKKQAEENEEIKIGDEVCLATGARFVVYNIVDDSELCGSGINEEGKVDSWSFVNKRIVKKARHFPEVAELLEKLNRPN